MGPTCYVLEALDDIRSVRSALTPTEPRTAKTLGFLLLWLSRASSLRLPNLDFSDVVVHHKKV